MNRAERDNKISLLGYEPTAEYITQTYGEGWKKKEAAPLPPTGQGAPPLPKEFSDVSDLTLKRAALRADQQSLTDAAEYLSTHYKTMGWAPCGPAQQRYTGKRQPGSTPTNHHRSAGAAPKRRRHSNHQESDAGRQTHGPAQRPAPQSSRGITVGIKIYNFFEASAAFDLVPVQALKAFYGQRTATVL